MIRTALSLGIALIVLWMVLWIGFRVVAGLVHLLVLVGVVLLAWALIRRFTHAG